MLNEISQLQILVKSENIGKIFSIITPRDKHEIQSYFHKRQAKKTLHKDIFNVATNVFSFHLHIILQFKLGNCLIGT